MLQIEQLPVLSDNYIYLIRDPATGQTGVVDPALAEPVLDALARLNWQLTHIINTHHHSDHVGGNEILIRETGCTVVGPRADRARIPGIVTEVGDGDTLALGAARATVYDVPGHTRGHIAYWFAESAALFCGDTLFALGCGRMFEGAPPQFWASLSRIKALPSDTTLYCAHEYTASNARFALHADPDNAALKAYADEVTDKRTRGEWTVPTRLDRELATNPFLRADAPDMQARWGGGDAVATFAALRSAKDSF